MKIKNGLNKLKETVTMFVHLYYIVQLTKAGIFSFSKSNTKSSIGFNSGFYKIRNWNLTNHLIMLHS